MDCSRLLATANTPSEGDGVDDIENLIYRGRKPVGSVSAWALLYHNLPTPGKSSL